VAFAVLGRAAEAETERKKFYAALENKALEKRRFHTNIMHDSKHTGILDVAEAVHDIVLKLMEK
jgi:hypothetical protein